MLRARLSLFALESRENPSGPELIDPIGIPTVPPTDPLPPPPPSTTPAILDIATGIVGGATGTVPATPPDDTNGIIKISLDPYIIP